jgi:3D-(3,5/4)-trihydroxycyclohexane-1,2-dione acylhydrolase (decyclizing)
VPIAWEATAAAEVLAYAGEVERLVAPSGERGGPLRQASVIGAVNDAAGERGVVVCAAGSLPGDLHKLWRARDPDGKGYHVEYGYSCMGYEIPGGIGVRLAAPDREVYVMVGDGSYMMGPTELATAVAEGVHIVVVLLDNHGFASIGALSRSLGSAGFGTIYRRSDDGAVALDAPDGSGPAGASEPLGLDLAGNAQSLGAAVLRARDLDELRAALVRAHDFPGPVVIAVETDRYAGLPGNESWWDVPVAEVSEMPAVAAAREEYERARRRQRSYLGPP